VSRFARNTVASIGYDKNENNELLINKEEAVIARRIFDMFLEGISYGDMAKQLTNEKIPTVTGKQIWQGGTIRRILHNEKYAGNCIIQKKGFPNAS